MIFVAQNQINLVTLNQIINFTLYINPLILFSFDQRFMEYPLSYSRLSKPQSEAFRSTGTSLVFKTVGRGTRPSWSNRITKDINDLQYNLDSDYFGKPKFSSVTLESRRNKYGDKRNKLSAREKRRSFFQDQLNNIVKTARFLSRNDTKSKQQLSKTLQAKKTLLNKSQQLPTYGLCTYEFKNTINGRLKYKPNLHLQFDKKPQRHQKPKTTWYNPQLQISIEKMDQKKYRRVLEKYHSFESYTERRVFQTKNKLDKVYEIEEGKRKTSPNRIKRTVPIDTVPGRKEQVIKESSYLSYPIERGQQATSQSPPKYSILQTPKEFKFSKQVINDKRGCYR